ncbi:MAG TPA: MFS transporter [Nevskiaceae bacterium]|nr:MFS transporter [Nevskiaceae bacterium]
MSGGPFAALRYREFRFLLAASFINTIALLIQEVALSYDLYKLTHDPLVLGLLGLAEAIPFMALALFGGHLADRREKRGLMLASLSVILCGSVVLWWATQARLAQDTLVWTCYAVIGLLGFARGVFSPATASLKPFLVPREHYGNSATWSSTSWQAGAIAGPLLAGLLYAGLGIHHTLLVVIGLILLNLALLGGIARRPAPPAPEAHDNIWASLAEGIAYVRQNKVILYAISLDMFSVLFGGVVAILPVYAQDILAVGAQGLGLLRAAPAVGAMITVIACAWWPPLTHAWRNLLLVVAGFGAATLVFGVSTNIWLSMAALFLTGAFDSVSVIIRSTLLQALPPDHLRGRVVAVNSIFISASNELGAFESGTAARLMGVVPSVLAGAAVTLVTVGWVWRKSTDLLRQKLL